MALHRVELDCSFVNEADADALANFAKSLLSKTVNINEGQKNEEPSRIKTHICLHDEGKSCPPESVKVTLAPKASVR